MPVKRTKTWWACVTFFVAWSVTLNDTSTFEWSSTTNLAVALFG